MDFIYPLRYINIIGVTRFRVSDLIYERIEVENAKRTELLTYMYTKSEENEERLIVLSARNKVPNK